jgi:NAD(P)-dependent dehydrogenase (short-subunit alcohol dehydrogenase family)
MVKGKVIAVTGATGVLGGAVVRALLDTGASVALVGGRQEKLARLLAGLNADERASAHAGDLTDEQAVAAVFAAAAERFGGLDGLAATAGGFGGGQPVHETAVDAWREQQQINLTTAFLSCRAVTPYLLQRGGGAIVTVGSRPALHGTPSIAAYSVAKSGVLRLTEAMAEELKNENIAVNCILPGTIDTPANRAAMPKANPDKWTKPEAIAAVVRWLLSDEARIISGAAIPVYGRS